MHKTFIFISFYFLFFVRLSFAQTMEQDNHSKNKKEILEAINSFNKNNTNNSKVIIYDSNNQILYHSLKKEKEAKKEEENINTDLKKSMIQKNIKDNTKKASDNKNSWKKVILYKYLDNMRQIRYSLEKPEKQKILELCNIYQYIDSNGISYFSYKEPVN